MTTYLIKGINAEGRTERSETVEEPDLYKMVMDVTYTLDSSWTRFTVEVEAVES